MPPYPHSPLSFKVANIKQYQYSSIVNTNFNSIDYLTENYSTSNCYHYEFHNQTTVALLLVRLISDNTNAISECKHSSRLLLQCSQRILLNETVILVQSNSKVLQYRTIAQQHLIFFCFKGQGWNMKYDLGVSSVFSVLLGFCVSCRSVSRLSFPAT